MPFKEAVSLFDLFKYQISLKTDNKGTGNLSRC
jgi:hypothetical protein